MGKQLCMGCSKPRLHFDHGGEALLQILKGNIVEWACYPHRILVPGVAEPMKPPILAIVGIPPSSTAVTRSPGSVWTTASSASRLPWWAVQLLAPQRSGA